MAAPDWTIAKIIIGLIPIATILLIPLLLAPKSSGVYIWLWSGYGIVTTTVILSALWAMTNYIPPKDPQGGFPMSPIGDATFGRLIHGFGFLASIPMLLYILTLGLPWKFTAWPHGQNRKSEQDVDPKA